MAALASGSMTPAAGGLSAKTIATASSVDYRAVVTARQSSSGRAPTAAVTVTTYARENGRWVLAHNRRLPETYFWKTDSEYMTSVLIDEKARTADRLEAARWLADRGFGRSVQALDVDIRPHPAIDLALLSMEDLEALSAIIERYPQDVRTRLSLARSRSDPASSTGPTTRGLM
ncbi:MAG: hypothetical protein ACRDKY_09680 [Solirubrobacteraceae bacterium]